MGTSWKVLLLLLWAGLCRGAEPSIYAYTDSDGSLFLSNVPADSRYRVLIGDRDEPPRRPAASPGPGRSAGHPAGKAMYSEIIERTASRYGLESALLHAVIAVESGYNPAARSRKGAGGMMQLMPNTARRYGVADAFDPEQNIDGGARYLRDLQQLFASDLDLVLAAYNAGEHAVLRNQKRIPRFRETLAYVPKVLAHYRRNLAAGTGHPAASSETRRHVQDLAGR